ncbi:hypothetical protein [Nannocystis pusilla]|uniref:Uncharacterized protein n=1 Tax=Nannocystis pusilla TaxID=889268 RepID=A0ABS7TSC2_9BACT|nr:hypothetical protein [Nannocystis pusilla]MBZ5711132.1 hypothetical protein [Nannocystis pusilla]
MTRAHRGPSWAPWTCSFSEAQAAEERDAVGVPYRGDWSMRRMSGGA